LGYQGIDFDDISMPSSSVAQHQPNSAGSVPPTATNDYDQSENWTNDASTTLNYTDNQSNVSDLRSHPGYGDYIAKK